MNKIPVVHRVVQPKDLNLIYSTWLRSYRQQPAARNMSNDTFFYHHKQIIEKILSKPNTVVTIICSHEDPDHIYGYSVVEKYNGAAIIHYVYVKHSYRKLGLAKDVLTQSIPNLGSTLTFVTHESRNHSKLKDKFNIEFNPYLI